MKIKIQSIHFDASKQLEEFATKKVSKLTQYMEEISSTEITFKVIKPESNNNKETEIKITIPKYEDLFASKVADTFEEATDLATDAIIKQVIKLKEKSKK